MTQDPSPQQIAAAVDALDAQAKKRAAELMVRTAPSSIPAARETIYRAIRESAFCLGYKAGVVDLTAGLESAERRASDTLRELTAVYEAVCVWRKHVGSRDANARQLIAAIDAIDAARKASPKSLLDWGEDGLYDDARAVHLHGRCHAMLDGECSWRECPQRKEYKTRCPLDQRNDDEG